MPENRHEHHGSMASMVDIIVDHLVRLQDGDQFVLGPLVYRQDDVFGQVFYFTIGAQQDGTFALDCVELPGEDDVGAGACRASVIAGIKRVIPSAIVHEAEDEVMQARFCAALWPCAKSREVLAICENAAGPVTMLN